MFDQDCVLGTVPVKVVALHGWFGSATGWRYLPELVDWSTFSDAFLNYRGYGVRKSEFGDYSLEEISADARALADRLGWDRFALLGHSMGGAAALRTYADAPERTTAVVGLSPVSAVGVPLDENGWALFGGAAWDDKLCRMIIDPSTDNRLSGRWLDDMVRF
jgi:pimeloyl-ACP methyl ester carboxylesterase